MLEKMLKDVCDYTGYEVHFTNKKEVVCINKNSKDEEAEIYHNIVEALKSWLPTMEEQNEGIDGMWEKEILYIKSVLL